MNNRNTGGDDSVFLLMYFLPRYFYNSHTGFFFAPGYRSGNSTVISKFIRWNSWTSKRSWKQFSMPVKEAFKINNHCEVGKTLCNLSPSWILSNSNRQLRIQWKPGVVARLLGSADNIFVVQSEVYTISIRTRCPHTAKDCTLRMCPRSSIRIDSLGWRACWVEPQTSWCPMISWAMRSRCKYIILIKRFSYFQRKAYKIQWETPARNTYSPEDHLKK